jgi:hypothetical protein
METLVDSKQMRRLGIMQNCIADKYGTLKPLCDKMRELLSSENLERYTQIARSIPAKDQDALKGGLAFLNDLKTRIYEPNFKFMNLLETSYFPTKDAYDYAEVEKVYNSLKLENPENIKKHIDAVTAFYKSVSTVQNTQLEKLIYEEMLRRTIIKLNIARTTINEFLDVINVNDKKYSDLMAMPAQRNFKTVVENYKDAAESNLVDLTIADEQYAFLKSQTDNGFSDKLLSIVKELDTRLVKMNNYYKRAITDVNTINEMLGILKSYSDEEFREDARRDWTSEFTTLLNELKMDEKFKLPSTVRSAEEIDA